MNKLDGLDNVTARGQVVEFRRTALAVPGHESSHPSDSKAEGLRRAKMRIGSEPMTVKGHLTWLKDTTNG